MLLTDSLNSKALAGMNLHISGINTSSWRALIVCQSQIKIDFNPTETTMYTSAVI
jgi:hypothetical protein